MAWCLFGAMLFARGYLQTNVITLDLSAHIRSNTNCVWNEDTEIAQRMLIISVHLAHIFNCWTLVAPKVSLSPCCDYGWLACKLYRATATHAAATRYPGTSWPTIPRDTGLQHSCAIRAHRQAPEQQLRTQPVGHCTRVQDSRTVASTVTRTRILLDEIYFTCQWMNTFNKVIPWHQNLHSSHIGAIGRHHELLCMYFCIWKSI